jgi:predicted GIY-YIG superfamily endonuclease
VDISQRNIGAIVWCTLSNSRTWKRQYRAKKRSKAGAGKKKDKLIESKNPSWKDLAADWYPEGLLKDGVPIDFNKAKT